jgi:hypothetical protein
MKFNINNPKFVKMFNATCARAWHHKRERIRKKNYTRAQRMLDVKRIKKKLGVM